MAVPEDYEALDKLTKKRCGMGFQTVIGCSLNHSQVQILSHRIGVPTVFTIDEWNLDQPCPATADVIVACNVFHYAQDPIIWFGNALTACKELWIQDLFCRQRSSDSELGGDGDAMRYGLRRACVGQPVTYDLHHFYSEKLLDYWCYDAGSMRAMQTSINFIAVLKGDL